MKVDSKSRQRLRLTNVIFVVLFLAVMGLLGWLSTRYTIEADWTAGNRNTLSEASRKLLDRLEGNIVLTAYASERPAVRRPIKDMVERYRRYRDDITLTWVNPETRPTQVREAGISSDGEMIVSYQGREEKVSFPPGEEQLTNAIQRVARSGEKWLVFVTGHGERDPLANANFDLGAWGRQLRDKGIKIETVNLARQGRIPDNATAVVIAGPQVDLLPAEVELLQSYIEQGGNLLWFADPGPLHGLEPVARQLGITLEPGAVVDPTTQLLGISDPSIVVVTEYSGHAIVRGFNFVTVFPQARGIEVGAGDDWQADSLLHTAPGSWSETGKLQGAVQFDEGEDIDGPLALGVAMSRAPGTGDDGAGPGGEQRVVVIGDGDFLANTYLGNGGNQDLGMNIVNWVTSDEVFLDIPVKAAPDTELKLSKSQMGGIGFTFLVFVPLLLLGSGLWIWWRRRRR